MNSPLLMLFIIIGASLGHYRGGYESRNLIVREEPHSDMDGTLVECPVCENPVNWLPSHEECNIVKGNKRFKKCERGTYVNEVCGNRLDCYRGPGEQCTEKMEYDVYGQKCAHGFYCDNGFHVCTGLDYTIDSDLRYILNHVYRYPLRSPEDQSFNKPKSLMFLA